MKQVAQKFVTIRWASPSHLLPPNMLNDVTRTIGSSLSRNGRDVLMGLDRDERSVILPPLVGVDTTSPNWEKRVREFYADLAVHVKEDGRKLNITTISEKKNINGRMVDVDMPEIPLDYVMYRQCLVSERVANKPQDVQEGTYSFYIENLEQEKQREKATFRGEQIINQEFIKLTEVDNNEEYLNPQQIKFVALVMGRNPNFHDMDDLVLEIRNLKDASIRQLKNNIDMKDTDFMKIVKDDKLRDKAFIITLVDKGILAKEGNYYVDADNRETVLGDDLESAVSYVRNVNNSDKVLSYKQKLKILKEEPA